MSCRIQRLPAAPQARLGNIVFPEVVIAITILLLAAGFGGGWCDLLVAADNVVPHAQDKPPGPPLTPAEAIAKMTVPPGFTVELVASEPNIVNPVAMAIDDRGRFWITESLEYPRRDAGPGKDRVKVLEDTDGDGQADKFTVFADGLNIPSGIAVGHGGVWVANSPDLLFLQDTDGDGKADKSEVVVTGFGRTDTHELPNSLTWGPDGFLYGLNGVFNYSHVKYPPLSPHFKPDQPGWQFTCALFRINPRTKEFNVFCEGTSNPWGVTFDAEGSAFISACVIDHLWHLTETGYYHRQGGPYPPFTWKLESIVKHKHQKAAYCGITYFDSDAYPEPFRDKLYMGNIHGGCLNVDKPRREGGSYFATLEPDFLTANDAWFMPVVQKTGPDGSLYVLDWYDRYHCYQDAGRDPQGIDRLRGRLYRVRYKDSPRAKPFDLAKETDDQLLDRLHSPNIYFRENAQRILAERHQPDTARKLEQLVLDEKTPQKARLHALWALIGSGPLGADFHLKLLAHDNHVLRAWAVRAAGNQGQVEGKIVAQLRGSLLDPAPDVQVQAVIASCKVQGINPIPSLMAALAQSRDDKLIPPIVWQNLHPLLETRSGEFLDELAKLDLGQSPAVAAVLPRAIERILAVKQADPAAIAAIFALVTRPENPNPAAAKACLAVLAAKVQSREVAGKQLETLRDKLQAPLAAILAGAANSPAYRDAALLAATWRDEKAIQIVRGLFADGKLPEEARLAALQALIASGDATVLSDAEKILAAGGKNSLGLRGQILAALGRLEDATVASTVLGQYSQLPPELRPRAIELLTQRVAWGKLLVGEIAAKRIPAEALNINQVQKLLALGDKELAAAVAQHWGTIRVTRDPKREELIAQMRTLLHKTPGDAKKGQAVFTKVCGQCHKMYGEGQEVGPDITANGRSSFEQLLSNVFDPSLVIGASYQARTVRTTDGRVLTGLLAEDSPQRVVLRIQGGKQEVIARSDVEAMKVSELSLMPEGLEKQLQPAELADLFAYITLDKPPGDPSARRLQGTPEK